MKNRNVILVSAVGTALLAAVVVLLILAPWKRHRSEYAGEETREIKTLAPEDLQELRAGGGWGLARAAELNGVPGPAHLLPMAEEIGLSPEQVARIEEIYGEMKNRAIPLGEELIELERELNRRFAEGTITEESLRRLVDQIGDVTSDLRYVHLQTHLTTPELLTADQIARYNRLRGYDHAGDHAH